MKNFKVVIRTEKMSWAKVRKLVLLRDNNACCECGRSDKHKSYMHVHHKDMDKTNNDPNNLVTLCVYCHGKIHADPNFEIERNMLLIKKLVQTNGISINGELAPTIGVSQPAITSYLNSAPSGFKRMMQFKEFINDRLNTNYSIEELFSMVPA